MNILAFIPFTRNSSHLGMILEIIEKLIQQGDSVTAVSCNGNLLSCAPNISHSIEGCIGCISKKNEGLKLLSKKLAEIPIIKLSYADRNKLSDIRSSFNNIEELKSYKINNFDIGEAVLSTLITSTRDNNPDFVKDKALILRLLYSAYSVYLSTITLLRNNKVDLVYVFNGRYANYRPVARASELLDVEYYTYDIGSTISKYGLYKNSLPHNTKLAHLNILRTWESNNNNKEKTEIAEKFYNDRLKGIVYNWSSFTEKQIYGTLPVNWADRKNNITIFMSSELEFKSIGSEWDLPFYKDQIDGVYKICNSLLQHKNNFHVYIRLHPPLVPNKHEILRDDMTSLDPTIATVIQPDSEISTYSLLYNSDKIITFGSTVGIEAVYWKKPSILAGNSFYKSLGGTYNPSSHDELIKMLKSDLQPKDKKPALLYGYYISTYGKEYKYYKPIDVRSGYFKDVLLEPKKNILWQVINFLNNTKIIRLLNNIFITYAHYRIFGSIITLKKILNNIKQSLRN